MLDWIYANSTLITAAVQVLTAVVWIVYLQIFIVSIRRQRRSNILINRVAGNDDRAHLLVGNMGAEPIYVSAILVDVTTGTGDFRAIVTDDLFEDDTAAGREAVDMSRQGPLSSAETRDIGALGDLMDRALRETDLADRPGEVQAVTITVAADGTFDRLIVAGQQSYEVHHRTDRRRFLPRSSQTQQIRARRDRRALSRRLNQALRDEAERVRQSGGGTAASATPADRAAG